MNAQDRQARLLTPAQQAEGLAARFGCRTTQDLWLVTESLRLAELEDAPDEQPTEKKVKRRA